MKLLFLDHYGVMLRAKPGIVRTWHSQPTYDELRDRKLWERFDCGAVKALNLILETTNADIVVSSDWKRGCTVKEMGDFYISQGIHKRPIDFTAWLPGYPSYHQQRAAEIGMYVETYPEITHWVAVDDLHLGRVADNNIRSWGLANFVWVENIQQGLADPIIIELILKYLGY